MGGGVSTYRILLDTISVPLNNGRKNSYAYEMVDLTLTSDGQWTVPLMTDTKVIGRKNATIEEVLDFSRPYFAKPRLQDNIK